MWWADRRFNIGIILALFLLFFYAHKGVNRRTINVDGYAVVSPSPQTGGA